MYVCRKLRLLIFLQNKGFNYIASMEDKYNPKYFVWLFVDTPELREAIEDYYDQVPKINKRS